MIPRYYPKQTGEKKPPNPMLCYTCTHKIYGERLNPSHYIECDIEKKRYIPAKRKCMKYEAVEA